MRIRNLAQLLTLRLSDLCSTSRRWRRTRCPSRGRPQTRRPHRLYGRMCSTQLSQRHRERSPRKVVPEFSPEGWCPAVVMPLLWCQRFRRQRRSWIKHSRRRWVRRSAAGGARRCPGGGASVLKECLQGVFKEFLSNAGGGPRSPLVEISAAAIDGPRRRSGGKAVVAGLARMDLGVRKRGFRWAAHDGQGLSRGHPPNRVVVVALAASRRQAGAALHGRAGGKAHRGNRFASSRARSRRRWAPAR